jgi:hypothetical protein
MEELVMSKHHIHACHVKSHGFLHRPHSLSSERDTCIPTFGERRAMIRNLARTAWSGLIAKFAAPV